MGAGRPAGPGAQPEDRHRRWICRACRASWSVTRRGLTFEHQWDVGESGTLYPTRRSPASQADPDRLDPDRLRRTAAMNPNPLSDVFAFLKDPVWTTPVFWVLLLASIGIAAYASLSITPSHFSMATQY